MLEWQQNNRKQIWNRLILKREVMKNGFQIRRAKQEKVLETVESIDLGSDVR